MGMAASQVRLLQLTSRKNTIGRQLEHLSMQKTSLTREMQGISKDYQNALSSKTLKWSTNSGASYVDLSYANLMRPGSANNNIPYLITDSSGKVVVDNNYKKYAEMLSPDGAPGGDWESNRTEILSSLTGIPAEDIEAAETASATVDTSAEKVNDLQEEVDELKEKCTKDYSDTNFFNNCLGNLGEGFNWDGNPTTNVGADYNYTVTHPSGHWVLSNDPTTAKTRMRELLDQLINNVSNYLTDQDLEAFKEACDTVYTDYSQKIDDAGGVTDSNDVPVSKFSNHNNDYCVRVDDLMETLMGAYRSAGGSCEQSSTDTSVYYYETVDRNSEDYKAYEAKKAELDAAKAEYDAAIDTSNQTLTSEQESSIAFYDKIFSAIAENGWTANSQVSDNDYLNQMLQNNRYYITTVETATDDDGKEYFEYDTNSATNFDNIFQVNDSDAQEAALVEYEYQKSIINEKESRIDTRMQNLETEQSAINEMIKGIETVRNDNTERTFSIFS